MKEANVLSIKSHSYILNNVTCKIWENVRIGVMRNVRINVVMITIEDTISKNKVTNLQIAQSVNLLDNPL